MTRPGCECVAELVPSGDDVSYCSKCGQEYRRFSGAAILKAVQLHGPAFTAEEHKGFMEYLREARSDDDDPTRDYEQKPETD